MTGDIAITDEQVEHNKMGWTVFDFFKHQIKTLTDNKHAGWYAYKFDKKNKTHYFKWKDSDSPMPSDKYLIALKKDGWSLSMTSEVIQNAFK